MQEKDTDSSWAKKCHDLHHTSKSPYSTANITDLEKWRFRADDWVDGGPIIGDDGMIYFGDLDRYIYAIYPNGTLKWKYRTGMWITSAPALAEDGTLYVGSWDGNLYAFNSTTGAKIWASGAGGTIASSPAIGSDGTIYVGTLDNRITATYSNGTRKWSFITGYKIASDPAIGDDGTIYIGSGDSYFYAMNPNGTVKWYLKTGDIIKAHPSIAEDGTIYIASFDGHLYALNPNGTLKWRRGSAYSGCSSVAIGEDGILYFGGAQLVAANPDNGTDIWRLYFSWTEHIAKSSLAISADGTIYFGTNWHETGGGRIYAVNPNGTVNWEKRIANSPGWVDSSPCIAEDGTVYIGSANEGRGYIHAFGPVESNSPPDAPTISGVINGRVGERYWYKFIAVDPDLNPISFYIDWGDGTHTDWTFEGASGGKYYYWHTWSKQGTYNISAKVKDVMGEESDWAYLEVTMPMNQQTQNSWWFLQFLQNHPRMFPMLRLLFDKLIFST